MPNSVKWDQYFAAQSAYLQRNPRRGAACHTSSPTEPSIILHGVKSRKLTIGRGFGSGVQVGRRNPRMSRQHFCIEHKPHLGYTLTVQSPNGVLVDRIMFMAGENIPLVNGSMIEVLGTKLIFVAGETTTTTTTTLQGDGQCVMPCMSSSSSSSTTATTTSPDTALGSAELSDRSSSSSSAESTTLDPVLYPTNAKGTSTNNNLGSATKITKTITTTTTSHHHPSTTTTAPDPSSLLPKSSTSASLDSLDTLIRLLANSRKTSMTIPEIERQLKWDRQPLVALIQTTACIGCIERTGNTADGTPKEHLYYYKPEQDTNDGRRLALSQSRRGARKCALKDTQYYFRIPPKLPNHRTKHLADNKRKHNEQEQPQQKDQQLKKKRRSRTKSKATATAAETPSCITTTTTATSSSLVASTTSSTTSSPFSLSSDDDLSDQGFLTSDDELGDKELTALFQDV